MTVRAKICGLTTIDAVAAAGDADHLGFIFFPRSPRNLTPYKAAELAAHSDIPAVAVTVDPDDDLLEAIFSEFSPDYIQLHGNESPERVKQIEDRFNRPVIKAFGIQTAQDITASKAYKNVADMLMFDAKLPKGMPGGNGVSFDWKILAGQQFNKPWFLSGGLAIDNVEEAVRISGAKMVDVSSSLESAPGVKNPELVRAFVKKVKSISQ
jgi:phosphoribosylanthranilate isomerase